MDRKTVLKDIFRIIIGMLIIIFGIITITSAVDFELSDSETNIKNEVEGLNYWSDIKSFSHNGSGVTNPSNLSLTNYAFDALSGNLSVYCMKHYSSLKNGANYNWYSKIYYEDLCNIIDENGNKFAEFEKYVIPYAVTFSQKGSYLNGSYSSEKAQQAIWAVTNDAFKDKLNQYDKEIDDGIYQDDAIADLITGTANEPGQSMYFAGLAVSEYMGRRNSHPDTATVSVGTNAGTTLKNNNSTYLVGPFTMGDYVYAYSGFTEIYSGNLLGGIIGGEIVLQNDVGNTTTIAIGNGAKIVYTDASGNATNKGKDNWEDEKYCKVIPDYQYPWPNSTFYIEVDRSKTNGATKLSDISFNFQKTQVESSGWRLYAGSGVQPLLVVESATVRLQEYKKNSNVNVRLTTDITIKKYITKVEHVVETKTIFDSTARSSYNKATKSSNTVKIEKGDKVTYRIDIKNAQSETVKVKIQDVLPASCSNSNFSPGIADWLTIPGNSTKTITVTLIATGTTGTYENKVEIITKNSTSSKVTTTSRNGPVVNIAELNGGILSDSDYYTIKEYNASLDKYINEVKHNTGTVTYSGTDRKTTTSNKGTIESTKANNPVYVEYGDIVTYTIRIYNTTSPFANTADSPYYSPDKIYASITDSLPTKYSNLSISVSNNTGTKSSYATSSTNGGKFTITDIQVPAAGYTDVTVKLTVEDDIKDTVRNNTASVTSIKNINKETIQNNSSKSGSSDYYKVNNYNLKVDKYISGYNAEVMKKNNENGFTNETYTLTNRAGKSNAEKSNNPVPVEKTETLVYYIKLTNNSTSVTNGTMSSGTKRATQIRPSTVTDALEVGLEIAKSNEKYQVIAAIYKSDGSKKSDVSVTVKQSGSASLGDIYTFDIGNDVILDPSEYIIYSVTVKVIENNMHLYNLENVASITTATNINDTITAGKHSREIQKQNVSEQQTSSDYVRLKDLVIAGKVWLDKNKDGSMNDDETRFENIVVKLFNVKNGVANLVRTTKTNSDGLYTFAKDENGKFYSSYNASKLGDQRINKATNKNATTGTYNNSTLEEYYIEFEYDGLIYKSTEIYGGVAETNTKNNGDNNINEKWLPTSTKDPYLTDSNAYEFEDVRQAFNNNYETIAYNKAYSINDTESILSYDKNGHVSTLLEDKGRIITARSFITKGTNASIDNTNKLWLYKESTYNLPETEYLKYINLGLEEREDVDISLTKDVYEVKTTINGEEIIYTYDQLKEDPERYKRLEEYNENADGSVDYSESEYLINEAYELSIYESDYKYRYTQYLNEVVNNYKGKESELNIEATYKIVVSNDKITNNEPNRITNGTEDKDIKVHTVINEIVDYYDTNFIEYVSQNLNEIDIKTFNENGYLENTKIKIAEAWLGDESGNLIKELELGVKSDYNSERAFAGNGTTENGYNTSYITGGNEGIIELAEGENAIIYVKYVIDKEDYDNNNEEESSRNLKIEDDELNKYSPENSMGIENIAQVGAYSTYYYKNGVREIAGLVDRDSNPANLGDGNGNSIAAIKVGIDESDYYEDNTCKTAIDMIIEKITDPPGGPDDPDDPDNPDTPTDKLIRTLSGSVWDDSRTEEETDENGVQYVGNGKYSDTDHNDGSAKMNENVDELGYITEENAEEKDIKVKNAKAEIIEIVEVPSTDSNGNIVSRYYEEAIESSWPSVPEARTADDGSYTLSGFIPGYYIVRFSYGDTTDEEMLVFNGQDYKSTQYTAGVEDGDDDDNIMEALEKANQNDARDDEISRLQAIGYSETMTNNIAEVLKAQHTYYEYENMSVSEQDDSSYDADLISKYQEELIGNTEMTSETVTFHIKPEKLNSEVLKLAYSKTYNTFKNMMYEDVISRVYAIKNIDFGVEYRPETQVSLSKVINYIELITSDSEVLVKVAFETQKDESGNVVHVINTENSIGLDNLQFISNDYKYATTYELLNEFQQGFVYINVDEDILQGCTIKIEYGFTVTNESEIDRINENLNLLRYKDNTEADSYSNYIDIRSKITTVGNIGLSQYNKTTFDSNKTYSAAITAAKALYDEYYETDGNKLNSYTDENGNIVKVESEYRTKPKYFDSSKITIGNTNNNGYFGRYLGSTYYTGNATWNDENNNEFKDVLAEIKFDKILDYIDNNLTFNETENSSENKLWATATSVELLEEGLVNKSVFTEIQEELRLVDIKDTLFDTDKRSNLVISVDDRMQDNKEDSTYSDENVINSLLSKFLQPKTSILENQEDEENKKLFSGSIDLVATKLISPETLTEEMNYENVAEIIQFTTTTGRRTNFATTVGNAKIATGEFLVATQEPDTSATEQITLTPPTGLSRTNQTIKEVIEKTGTGVAIIIIVISVVLIGIVVTKFIIVRIKKRPIK